MQQSQAAAVSQPTTLTSFSVAARIATGTFPIPQPEDVLLLNVRMVFDARARHMSLCAARDVKKGMLEAAEAEELSVLEKLAKIDDRPIHKLKQFHDAGCLVVKAQVVRAHQAGVQVFVHVRLEAVGSRSTRFDGEQLIVPAWCFGEISTTPGASTSASVN